MAVSLIEASTARAATEHMPVSRLRPDRDLVDRVGVEFCLEHEVVPLWREPGGTIIATAHPRDQSVLRVLRERLAQQIIVRLADPAEIPLCVANALGTPTATDWRRAFAAMLQRLHLLSADQAAAYVLAADDEPYLGAALVTAGLIAESERIEAVGLAFNLPTVDLAQQAPREGLDALLALEVMHRLQILPLWSIRHELFVATINPPSADVMEELQAALGLAIRPVLVQPGPLRARFDELPPERAANQAEIGEAVQRAGLVSRAQFETAHRVHFQTGEALHQVLHRLNGVSADQLQEALARAAGVGRFRGFESVHTEAVRAVPAAISRQLNAVVIARDHRDVTLAMADPWNMRARRAIGALLECDVQPVLATGAELERIIEEHGTTTPTVLAIGDPIRSAQLLVQAGFVSRESADAADLDLRNIDDRSLPRLWYLLTDEQRSIAVALDAGLPRVHELLLRPEPEALAMLTETEPSAGPAPQLLPLVRGGDLLPVAVPSPGLAAEARELASRHRFALRLAITREDHIARALDQLRLVDLTAVPPSHRALGRIMETQFRVTRGRTLSLFARLQQTGEPIDLAASRLRFLTGEEFRDALATYLHTDAISLRRSDRLETTHNDRGVAVSRRVIDDPVDHDLARILTIEDADRLGALPVARRDGAVAVAVSTPPDDGMLAELRSRIGVPFRCYPATRADIREAARRAHRQLAVGDLLFEAGVINREQLDRALDLADQSNVRVGEALMSLGYVSEEELGEQLARQRGLPFVAVRGLDLDRSISRLLPEEFARTRSMLPLSVSRESVTIAVAEPGDTAAMREAERLVGQPVTFCVTTRSDIRDGLERLYHEVYLEYSAEDLMQRNPEDSAYRVLSRGQKIFFISFSVFLVVMGVLFTVPTLTVIMALSTAFYLSFSGYKFYLIYRALQHSLEVPVTDEEVAALDDRELPIYTLLVPLYRETQVLPFLVRGIQRLDYPKEKLDVKLLLEEDDTETIAVARLFNLPSYFDITIVPDGQPKGKPKACNYGLLHARGEYAVIFDAEDIPEPDQLKKVLIAFRKSPPNMVCIQAKLNYFNRNQNVLTKWFTTEYSTWFDLFLPGLDASGAPIPLGGTSNHFKVEALRIAGAWDPFNVTEDADLGLRIFKLGGRTAVVDSTTYEEANSVLDNWIRQRSRWVKGYIQTWLVHMRHPIRLWQQLGTAGFLSFQLVIGGTFFGFLLNPLLWGLTGLWFITEWSVIQQIFPGPIYYMGAISLYAGNFAFAYMNVAGCLRRRYYSLVKWALLSPVYWVLMSIAAWKGFLQLFYRPFYWEKTIHGLANTDSFEALAELNTAEA